MRLSTHAAAFAVVVSIAALAGCASEVRRDSVTLIPTVPEAGTRFELQRDVSFKLDSGYVRGIAARTEFSVAGRVAQGLVFRPTQTVFTVEGAHMHEAYLVVRGDSLVGFYLPVEKAFSPLSQATPFPLVERK